MAIIISLEEEDQMAKRRTLIVSWEQRRELENGRDHDRRPYVRERCAALLKIAAGQSAHRVAKHAWFKARDPDTVYAWLDRYAREGWAGLVGHAPGGYQRSRLRAGPAARSPAGG